MEIPAWLLALSVPIGGFIGALITALVTRNSALKADATARHAELMRTLRWASELAVAEDEAQARLGILELVKLGRDPSIGGREQDLIDAALKAAQYVDQLAVEEAKAGATAVLLEDNEILNREDEEGM